MAVDVLEASDDGWILCAIRGGSSNSKGWLPQTYVDTAAAGPQGDDAAASSSAAMTHDVDSASGEIVVALYVSPTSPLKTARACLWMDAALSLSRIILCFLYMPTRLRQLHETAVRPTCKPIIPVRHVLSLALCCSPLAPPLYRLPRACLLVMSVHAKLCCVHCFTTTTSPSLPCACCVLSSRGQHQIRIQQRPSWRDPHARRRAICCAGQARCRVGAR